VVLIEREKEIAEDRSSDQGSDI